MPLACGFSIKSTETRKPVVLQPTQELEESRVIEVGLRVVVVAAGNRNELFRLVGRLEELPSHGVGDKPVGRTVALHRAGRGSCGSSPAN